MISPSILPIFLLVPANIHTHIVNAISTHRSIIFSFPLSITFVIAKCFSTCSIQYEYILLNFTNQIKKDSSLFHQFIHRCGYCIIYLHYCKQLFFQNGGDESQGLSIREIKRPLQKLFPLTDCP